MPAQSWRERWRERCRSLIAALPWETCATLPLPQTPYQRKLDIFNPFPSSQSRLSRGCLSTVKREVSAVVTHAAAVITVVLLFIFLLGAESSLHTTTFPGAQVSTTHGLAPRYGRKWQPTAISPIHRQLHHVHRVPVRYLQLMNQEQQSHLLDLLSSPAGNSTLAHPTRRAVFTHISRCRLNPCIRAFASAVAYARTTARVAVIFADPISRRQLSNILPFDQHRGTVLGTDAMLIPMSYAIRHFSQDEDGIVKDWAEFSVIDTVLPPDVPTTQTASTTLSGAPDDGERSPTSQFPKADNGDEPNESNSLSVIGNSNRIASLDGLAAVESHVSLSLSEVVWSRYAPRAVQEELLSALVDSAPPHARRSIAKASLLGRYPETRDLATAEDILHLDYHVPRLLLRGMSPVARKLLLLKLVRKKRQGQAHPRAIFIHAQYGLGNRLRALGSAMAFARSTDRVLVLIWVPDQHLNCRFTDLFVSNDEFVVSDSFDAGETWPFTRSLAEDPKMKLVKWYNYMRVNGEKINTSDDLVINDVGHHIYISTCYVVQSPVTPFIIRTQSSFWQVLKSLTPQIDVVRLVDRFVGIPIESMIGVHIRGRNIKSDISGVNAADYSEESSKTTDYWRNLTQVETFIDEMRRQPPDQLFYVAADKKEVFDRLEREFPSRVFYTPRHCDSRDKDCLPFALADILLLAKCSSLRGSYWSSFSELSVRIGGARFLLAGIDFGRP